MDTSRRERCRCGLIVIEPGTSAVRLGDVLHERPSRENGYCGPWASHELRDAREEIDRLREERDEYFREGEAMAEALQQASARNEQMRVDRDRLRAELDEQHERIGKVLEREGCSCDCHDDYEYHDEDCDRCLACRVEMALATPKTGTRGEG